MITIYETCILAIVSGLVGGMIAVMIGLAIEEYNTRPPKAH